MKRKKLIIIPVSLAILTFFLILTENGKYFVRYAVLNFPDINDYKKYPAYTISKADNYFMSHYLKWTVIHVFSYMGEYISNVYISLL